MTYLGTAQISPVDNASVENMRRDHLAWIEQMRQNSSPVMQERARLATLAMDMTEEALTARVAELRAEEQVVLESLRSIGQTNNAQRGELVTRLDQIRNEITVLRADGNRRRNERMAPELAAQQARQEAELRDMWSNGQWQDQAVYDRWLRETFPAWYGIPARVWLGSVHCAAVGTQDGRCANNAPGGRLTALGLTALPFATAYYAWKKKDKSLPWTAAGFAAGIVGPPVIALALFSGSMIALSAGGGSVRY